jgi:Lysylphosphatidylglycerol synthase TM region
VISETLELLASSAESLAGRLAGVSVALLAAALALHFIKVALRARAWHNIARAAYPDQGLHFRHSLGAYICGSGLNAVLPGRPGELLKLALFRGKAPGTTFQGLASTLITESVFDTVAGVTVLALGVAVGGAGMSGMLAAPLGPLTGHPWLASTVALAVVATLTLARRALGRRARGFAAEATRGLGVLGHPRRYLRTIAAWQLAALGVRLASICCFLAAFHLPVELQTSLLVLAVQSAANLIPLTPNGAGTQQALLVLALGGVATASSIVGFGAGAQLATACGDGILALISLVLMTGSLRWRPLLATRPAAHPAAGDPGPLPAVT